MLEYLSAVQNCRYCRMVQVCLCMNQTDAYRVAISPTRFSIHLSQVHCSQSTYILHTP